MSLENQTLTDKQAAFCEEYLVDLNGTQAAIRAGYSPDSARQLASDTLSKPYIQERIAELQAARSKRTEITADYVLSTIQETIERCSQRVAVTDEEGNETGEYTFKENGVLKGCELLGKHLKLFTDKQDVNLNATVTQMGRIKTEHVDASGNVTKKTLLTFEVGSPVTDDEEDDENVS